VHEAINTGKVIFSDLHRENKSDYIHIDLVAPLLVPGESGAIPIGAFILSIDPYKFLYPLIQSWPTPSLSGETLLVRKDGDNVLFLNELRHRKNTALAMRIPLDKPELPAAMAVSTKHGVVEGIDYRGVPVLAAFRPIPDSPWFMLAKMDRDEIYAPIRMRFLWAALFVVISVIAAGMGTAYLLHRQQAEALRKQNEGKCERLALTEHYGYLMKHANDIIILIDEDLKIIEVNERACLAYGYTRDEMLGMHYPNIHSRETRLLVDTELRLVKESDGIVYEIMNQRKNETTFPVEVSSRPMEIEGRIFYQCIIRDITDRKKITETLNASEVRYRRLFEAARDGILLLDADRGTITDANQFMTVILGYSYEEMLGKKLWEIGLFKDAALSKKAFSELKSKGYIRYDDLPLETKGGQTVEVEFVSNVYQVDHHEVIQCNIRDISERKLNDKEKETLRTQLRQAQKMEAIGQFAGGIAHDFNNILTAIIGFASLMQMKLKKDDPLSDYAEQILLSSDRAATLTQSLLAFGRTHVMNIIPVELSEIIDRSKRLISQLIGEEVILKTIYSKEDAVVMADSGMIEHVLMNLATNARDAMPKGGTLTITTEFAIMDEGFDKIHGYGAPGEYIVLSVSDTGMGMEREVKEKIFEPFFTTKEMGKGSGLGLSMVFGIVKQHKGYINCYSEPGHGTTFRIYLPACKEKVEEEKASKPEAVAIGGGETIFVVEDDENVSVYIKSVLETFGYKVIEAVDGEDAVKIFKKRNDEINLVLLDVIVPKMSGKEVYEEIKKINPDMKVIFTSGYPLHVMQEKGIINYEVEFLMKPVSPTRLQSKIREVLDVNGGHNTCK